MTHGLPSVLGPSPRCVQCYSSCGFRGRRASHRSQSGVSKINRKALVRPVADATYERKVTNDPLPLVPFSEWLEMLETSA
jgi:hypothetical protein